MTYTPHKGKVGEDGWIHSKLINNKFANNFSKSFFIFLDKIYKNLVNNSLVTPEHFLTLRSAISEVLIITDH